MKKIWSDYAWNDYIYWQTQDKKTLKKINKLILSIERDGFNKGLGKPEALKGNLTSWWSRKINDTDRLVYRVKIDSIEISQCKTHYGDK